MASTLVASSNQREFFVWVDPNHWLIKHHVQLVGSFSGGRLISNGIDGPDGLLFIRNPNPQALEQSISPFHSNITQKYRTEWNLELIRFHEFKTLPCRLHALYLLNSRKEAERYAETHSEHVKGRILKRCLSEGEYLYSVHDSAWIEFMNIGHSMDNDTVWFVGRSYWNGVPADSCELQSMGQAWRAETAWEVLFYGRVDFPNKALVPD